MVFPIPQMLSGKQGFTVELMLPSLAAPVPLPAWGAAMYWGGTDPASHTLAQVGSNQSTYPTFTDPFIVQG